jgi:sugar phosphate isomerase/epimerase
MDTDRISACSYPLRDRELDYAFGVIAAAGFRKVDLLGRLPHFSATDPSFRLETLERLLAGHGLRVANIGSYCGQGFCAQTTAARRAAMDELCATLDAAHQLGARSIRVVPGDGRRASIGALIPQFQEAAENAARLGVYLGFENHGGEISGVPEACRQLCAAVASPWFGVLYEPANLMAAGVDYRTALATLRDHIVHIHVKDGRHDAAGAWQGTMLGEGTIDLRWLWTQMAAAGYGGDFALEYEVDSIEPVETGYAKWFRAWQNA